METLNASSILSASFVFVTFLTGMETYNNRPVGIIYLIVRDLPNRDGNEIEQVVLGRCTHVRDLPNRDGNSREAITLTNDIRS